MNRPIEARAGFEIGRAIFRKMLKFPGAVDHRRLVQRVGHLLQVVLEDEDVQDVEHRDQEERQDAVLEMQDAYDDDVVRREPPENRVVK